MTRNYTQKQAIQYWASLDRWLVFMLVKHYRCEIGQYSTKDEAIAAYDARAKLLYDNRAVLFSQLKP
jgi:hypothetical protein